MAEKIMVFLTFLLIVLVIGTTVWVESRFQKIENTLALERAEMDEMKKKQRITAQDVKFLEYLVVEGEQK